MKLRPKSHREPTKRDSQIHRVGSGTRSRWARCNRWVQSVSASLVRAQTRRGAVGLIRQAGAPGSANRRRRPTYEASTTRDRLRTSRAYNRFNVTPGSVNAQRDTYIGKELFQSWIVRIRRLYNTLIIVSYFIFSLLFLSERKIHRCSIYLLRACIYMYFFVCRL